MRKSCGFCMGSPARYTVYDPVGTRQGENPMPQFTFETVPWIVCEQGGSLRLGEIAGELGISRVFVVTDRGLVKAGVIDDALAAIEASGLKLSLFSDVVADPPEASVLAAVAAARDVAADGVIGIGGGSSLDTAKLVALLACTAQPLAEIYGIGLARGGRLPL